MSEFLFPEKVRVINDPTSYPVTFKNAAGGTVAAAAAFEADIQFFGQVKTPFLRRATLTRGFSPQPETYSITAATATEIALAASIPNGTKAVVEIEVRTTSRAMEYVRPEYVFGENIRYSISIDEADTPNVFLYKLYKAMTLASYRERDFKIEATATNIDDVARTIDSLTMALTGRGAYVQSFKVTNEASEVSSDVTVFAPALVKKGSKGIGYGFELEFLEKLQYKNNTPYFFDDAERFDEKALYTMISFDTVIGRPSREATPSTYSDYKRFVLYIKETNTAYIKDLADFFLTTPATRFTSLDSNGLTVGFNDAVSLTNTNAASSATNLDSDHGILTARYGTLAAVSSKYVEAQMVVNDDTFDNFTLPGFKTNA